MSDVQSFLLLVLWREQKYSNAFICLSRVEVINYQPIYETYLQCFLVPETLDMVVRTLKIQRKLGYRRWSKSGTIKNPPRTQHHIVPPQLGSWLLVSPRISVFPPPGDARLVLVGFSDARSVESKRVAPPLLPLRDFTSLVVTHVVPRKDSLALILEELHIFILCQVHATGCR